MHKHKHTPQYPSKMFGVTNVGKVLKTYVPTIRHSDNRESQSHALLSTPISSQIQDIFPDIKFYDQ